MSNQKWVPITEPLNTEDTYRLVDIEGYVTNYALFNKTYVRNFPEILKGFKTGDLLNAVPDGWYKGAIIIGEDEYQYFEVLVK